MHLFINQTDWGLVWVNSYTVSYDTEFTTGYPISRLEKSWYFSETVSDYSVPLPETWRIFVNIHYLNFKTVDACRIITLAIILESISNKRFTYCAGCRRFLLWDACLTFSCKMLALTQPGVVCYCVKCKQMLSVIVDTNRNGLPVASGLLWSFILTRWVICRAVVLRHVTV